MAAADVSLVHPQMILIASFWMVSEIGELEIEGNERESNRERGNIAWVFGNSLHVPQENRTVILFLLHCLAMITTRKWQQTW